MKSRRQRMHARNSLRCAIIAQFICSSRNNGAPHR
jgi:hypothetical protein